MGQIWLRLTMIQMMKMTVNDGGGDEVSEAIKVTSTEKSQSGGLSDLDLH